MRFRSTEDKILLWLFGGTDVTEFMSVRLKLWTGSLYFSTVGWISKKTAFQSQISKFFHEWNELTNTKRDFKMRISSVEWIFFSFAHSVQKWIILK